MTSPNGTTSSRNFWFSAHDNDSMTPPNGAGTSSNLCFDPSCKCSVPSPNGSSSPSNFSYGEINVKEVLDFYNPSGSACYRLISPLPEHGNLWKYGNVFQTCIGSASPRGFRQPKKAPDVWRILECSLEELYTGSIRQEVISRKVEIDHGKILTETKSLSIRVLPGWKRGTLITFKGEGDAPLNQVPADVYFSVDEKPHPIYKREGHDLVVQRHVSLTESLVGTTINLTTLDGRNLSIPLTDTVITPNYELVIENEGMPITRLKGKKGCLRIKFEVQFPSKLTPNQETDFKNIFENVDPES
ncbi:putative chaperone DnaJ, HSP40/DnaJ peptide-binding protein [Dioscorea sansibarensis]